MDEFLIVIHCFLLLFHCWYECKSWFSLPNRGFNDLSYFLKVEKNTIYTIYLAINGLGNQWKRTSYCE